MSFYNHIDKKQTAKRYLLHDLESNKTKEFSSGKQAFKYAMQYIPYSSNTDKPYNVYDLLTGADITKNIMDYITR